MANAIVTTRDTQLEKQRIGKNAISLTEFDTTDEPAIAAGSVVEIGGSLFVVSGDEAITGWAGIGNDTDCYIKLVPGVADFTAEFTTDAPTWSTSKQGWYDGIDRFVAVLHRGATVADFESKGIIPGVQGNRFSSLDTARDLTVGGDADVGGDLDVTGDADVGGALGVTGLATFGGDLTITSDADHLDGTKKVRGSVYLAATTEDVVFDALDAHMPTTDDEILVSGVIDKGAVIYVVSRAKRTSATVITFYTARPDTGARAAPTVENGDAGAVTEIAIAW